MDIINHKKNNISFEARLNTYKVIKKESLVIPIIAVISSAICAAGYFFGSAGLYYDTYQKSNGKIKMEMCSKEQVWSGL